MSSGATDRAAAHLRRMPKYHLNVHNGLGDLIDEEGAFYADLAAAREQAIRGIRSLLSAELLQGAIDLSGRLDIVDDRGTIVLSVPFDEAVALRSR